MSVAPLRLRAQRDGAILCTGDGGTFFRTTPAFASRLAQGALAEEDRLFLENRGDWVEPGEGLAWEILAHGQARRLALAKGLDYLILVPTLRCNLSCDYCQVSRVAENRAGFDWDEATLADVLNFIDGLETPHFKIEFQGGEPTLRPDLLRAVIERCQRFEHAEFVICSNLQHVTKEILEIFDRDDVAISTSLDGDAMTHQHHRTATPDKTGQFFANLDMLTGRYGPGKISALPTIDPNNPPDADQLIDSYRRFGIHSIFLRPINFQGFARKRYKHAVAAVEGWDSYYEDFVGNIIARNWLDRSRVLEETYLSICLRRIFQPGAERHVDLRNPNPIGVDYLVIDHDGTFYPTDEARMLARSGVIDLSIGDVGSGIDVAKRTLLNRSASNSFDPDCQACAFQPYCGRDVIDDLSRYGTIDIPRLETAFCRRHRHVFDFAFALIYSPDPHPLLAVPLARRSGRHRPRRDLWRCASAPGARVVIPLRLAAEIEAGAPFVTRLVAAARSACERPRHRADSELVFEDADGLAFSGDHGIVSIDGVSSREVLGDVVLVDPARRSVERLIRANSRHNTLLVTERCDQLCQMCSQPPKKNHEDRFDLLREACLLAPVDATIGITGGEPTLYKAELFALVEHVLDERSDLSFHILSNGQHFEADDAARLRGSCYDRVVWGIPLYAPEAAYHDALVAKDGAFTRLHESFAVLVRAGARVELRTVVLTANATQLADLARHITVRLHFVESWSIMQLENIGFAKNRWDQLLFDHAADFAPVARALDRARLHGVASNLFNFPLCTVPEAYRLFAVRSISDWKQKYAPPCEACALKSDCAGFFEWHPAEHAAAWAKPL